MTEAKARETRGNPTTRVGKVVSDKMNRSVVVRVDRIVKDKLYKRYVRRKANFMAHDENNVCKIGDTVEIVESRPLSSRKRWRVRRVVRAAVAVGDSSGKAT
jgi:small subunit ribosomal protein S17